MVRLTGLEPARLATPEPKSGVSANFTTGAYEIHYNTLDDKYHFSVVRALIRILQERISFTPETVLEH